jgi:hypothetical protein
MAKFGIFASIATLLVTISIASLSSTDAQAVTPCVTKEFKTELAKGACTKGGQPAAKDAMKKFMKDGKKKKSDLSCDSCHSKLAPDYPNKPDAMKLFKELGGS